MSITCQTVYIMTLKITPVEKIVKITLLLMQCLYSSGTMPSILHRLFTKFVQHNTTFGIDFLRYFFISLVFHLPQKANAFYSFPKGREGRRRVSYILTKYFSQNLALQQVTYRKPDCGGVGGTCWEECSDERMRAENKWNSLHEI